MPEILIIDPEAYGDQDGFFFEPFKADRYLSAACVGLGESAAIAISHCRPGDDGEGRHPGMLCWRWAMYFSAAAASENDNGSKNFAS